MWEVRVTPAGDFDNHAFKSNHFEVRPLSAAMGACAGVVGGCAAQAAGASRVRPLMTR